MSVRGFKTNRLGECKNSVPGSTMLARAIGPVSSPGTAPYRKQMKSDGFLTANRLLDNVSDPRSVKLQAWRREKDARKARALKDRNHQRSTTSAIKPVQTLESSPRKDLGTIFADEGKTSFLTDMLSQMSVETTMLLSASKDRKPYSLNDTLITTSPSITNRFRVDEKKVEQQQKDGTYFRGEAEKQKISLEELGLTWTEFTANTPNLSDEWRGEISAVIGQAHLLCTKRLEQFFGLCTLNESTEAPSDGLTARSADLDGFWEVIMMQVDDVKRMFDRLEKKKKEGWVDEQEVTRAPKKKKLGKSMKSGRSKKPIERLIKGSKPGPVTPRTKAAKNRLAQYRKQMKSRLAPSRASALQNDEPNCQLLTPVRANKKERCELGTDMYVTTVRRSTRKTPSKYRVVEQADVSKMLADAEYSYKPNPALIQATSGSNMDGSSPTDFDYAPQTAISFDNQDGLCTPIDSRRRSRTTSMSSCSPSPSVASFAPRVTSEQQAISFKASGSVKKFAAVTPSSRVREYLGTDIVYTPVRRSRRLEDSATGQHCVDTVADMPDNSGYMPNPRLK